MIDVATALQNVLRQLQAKPERYKLFGIYWWPVKLLLKRQGYTTRQLYMLGDYQDAITADMVPGMDLQATLAAAFEEYNRNARFPHTGAMVENADGELVRLHDEDANL